METPKTALLGRTLDEIQQIVRNLGMPKFAAKQITSWLYDKKVETIDEMTNLSLKHREALKSGYEVGAFCRRHGEISFPHTGLSLY